MAISRYLSAVEMTQVHLCVNWMVFFESESFTRESLVKALQLTCQRHPFMRMKIVKDQDNRFKLVEKPSSEVSDIEWRELTNQKDFDDWQTRMNLFSSVDYDLSRGVFYIELYRLPPNQYRLFISINHGCADGRASCTITKDLVFYIDSILSGQDIPEVQSKPFLDPHNSLPKHEFDIEILRNEPLYVCPFQHYINQLDRRETNPVNIDKFKLPYFAVFKEFDPETSSRLFANCRANGATVQGVLSVAKMIWLINEKIDLSKQKTPIKYLDLVVMDMRDSLGLEANDVLMGASKLTWLEEFDPEASNLWPKAASTSARIKKFKQEKEGLKLWLRNVNSIPTNVACVLAGTMGPLWTPVDESSLKALKVHDLRFMLAIKPDQYRPPNELEKLYNFANLLSFTFMGRFQMAFHFSYPSLSLEWGQAYAENLYQIIKCFSETAGEISVKSVLERVKRFQV